MSPHTAIISILYIEDNPGDIILIRKVLERFSGIKITSAASLSSGRELLDQGGFDLILLDLNLPDNHDLTGLETLSKEYPTIPIIIISGNDDSEVISKAVAKGAQDYLLKSNLESEYIFKTIDYTLDRYRLFQQIKLKELESRQILSTISNVIFKIGVEPDNQFRYIFVNRAFCERFGKTSQEIEGKLIDEIFPKSSLEEMKSKYLEAIESKKTIQWEMSMDLKKEQGSGLVTIFPYFDHKGVCQFIVSSIHDLTEVNRANAELKKRNSFLSALFDNSLDAIVVADDQGNHIAANKEAEKLFEYPKEELLHMNVTNILTPENYDNVKAYKQYIGNEIGDGEFHFFTKSGKTKTAIYNSRKIEKDFNISAFIDITDKIQYQKEIKKLSMIARNTVNGAIITDTEGKTVWVNESTTRITGYQFEELIGKKPGDLLQGERTDPAVLSIMSEAIGSVKPFDVEVINYAKDGREYNMQIQSQPLFDDQQNHIGFFSLQTDITDRIAYQNKLTESKKRLELALSIGKIGILEWTYLDDKMKIDGYTSQILGVSPDLEYLNVDEFLSHIDLLERGDIEKTLKKARESEQDIPPKRFRLINNEREGFQWVELIGAVIKKDGRGSRLIATITDITDKMEHNMEIFRATIKAEENVRSQISSDIHDGLQQTLISSLFSLGAVKEEMGALSDTLKDKIQFAYSKINQALKDSSVIAHQLMPKVLKDFGLIDAVYAMLDEISILVKLNFYENIKDKRLPEDVELNFYRIIQEALNNILKHANATQIFIQIIESSDKITLNIEDDGYGFNTNDSYDGLGLMSMKNRVEALNGTIEIDSKKKKGTHILIEIANKK
jgi:PAS domain S-box-containing protein